MTCEAQDCPNTARYSTADGKRLCSLCAMQNGKPHVRDLDVPVTLAVLESLLDELDTQLVAAGMSIRQRLRLLLGSKALHPLAPDYKPRGYRGEF